MAKAPRPTTNWKQPNSPKIQRQLEELMKARKTAKPKSVPMGAKIAKTVVRTATKVASASVPGTALKVAKAAGRVLTSSNAKPGTIAGPRPSLKNPPKESKTGRVSKGDMKKFYAPAPRPKKKAQTNVGGMRTFSATSTVTKPRSMPSKKMNSR